MCQSASPKTLACRGLRVGPSKVKLLRDLRRVLANSDKRNTCRFLLVRESVVRRIRLTPDPNTFEQYRDAPPISIAMLLQKYALDEARLGRK